MVAVVVSLVALGAGAGTAWALGAGLLSPRTPAAASSTPASEPTPVATTVAPAATAEPSDLAPSTTPTATGFDLTRYSTADPASLWVVVNKQHPIVPLHYVPTDLVWVAGVQVRSVEAPDLQAMIAAAKADGVRLSASTAYRSYNFQLSIHADLVSRTGSANADRYSARAGFSEHQTGLALDLRSATASACNLAACFARTVEAQWVAEHAWEYGFVVRYTADNTASTGYAAEPWHLRYVGRDLAGWIHASGVGSLEEALGVSGGPDYPA